MVISDVERIPVQSIDTRIKNFHWLDLTMGIFDAYDHGALLAVLKDRHGNVTEGAGFNVFCVKGGQLATPERNVFEGMTRRTVIELARQLGIACALRPVSPSELRNADEVFITSTAGGVMPVTRIDGCAVGGGAVGPITEQLRRYYWLRADTDPRTSAVPYPLTSTEEAA